MITACQPDALYVQPIGAKPETSPAFPWIRVAPAAPYFITEEGISWTPIGHNEAITWPDLAGLYKRKNLAAVDTYLATLSGNGITCIRLMLEYCQTEYHYLERPVGTFHTNMIRLWDDLFMLCEKHGLRVLLTPYDTFWMRKRWRKHPYNMVNGGTCSHKAEWLVCKNTLEAIKRRLAFATQRWGGSGVLFAWDLWNEPEPAHAGNEVKNIALFITEISSFLRETEFSKYGKTHLQTVSAFAPHLARYPMLNETIFRHPSLDFATTHFYGPKALEAPTSTVKAAICTGSLVNKSIGQLRDKRPFFDSEHGPVKLYRKKKLTDAFDEEYFRYMQWAHLASGGVGGGMRWPYRHPHSLTPGMHRAQKSLAGFCALVNWKTFERQNIVKRIKISHRGIKIFACRDATQALIWLLRTDTVTYKGISDIQALPVKASLHIPDLQEGDYQNIFWHTQAGFVQSSCVSHVSGKGLLALELPAFVIDMAIYIKRME